MNDPLAQYRKKPVANVAEPTPPKGPEEYVAFDAKDKVSRLSIRQANAQARSPGYGYLLDITHDGPYGTNFVLYYSYMLMVLVDGQNLQPVIMAIQMGTAEFIQEYDPDRWTLNPRTKKRHSSSPSRSSMEQGADRQRRLKNGKPEDVKERGRSLALQACGLLFELLNGEREREFM